MVAFGIGFIIKGCKMGVELPSTTQNLIIRESVDSLCRDGARRAIYAILKQKPYNFTKNTLKAYLST